MSARLSVALSLGGHEQPRVALCESTTALAHPVTDSAVHIHALASRGDAHAGPEDVELRMNDAARLFRSRSNLGIGPPNFWVAAYSSLPPWNAVTCSPSTPKFTRWLEWRIGFDRPSSNVTYRCGRR